MKKAQHVFHVVILIPHLLLFRRAGENPQPAVLCCQAILLAMPSAYTDFAKKLMIQ